MDWFKVKSYCSMLKIDFVKFSQLDLEKQIYLVKNVNSKKIENGNLIGEIQYRLLGILEKQKEDQRKFDEQDMELENMFNNRKNRSDDGDCR